jgi:hypothetical protein
MSRFRHTRRLVIFLWAIGAAGPLMAQTPLAALSPFLPPGSVGKASPPTSSSILKLCGVMGTDEGLQFCIYDSSRKRSVWLGLEEKGYPFVVSAADPAHDSVTLDWQGQRLTLSLAQANSGRGANSVSGGEPPSQDGEPIVLTPDVQKELARAKALLADEIRQRRAKGLRVYTDGGPEGGTP